MVVHIHTLKECGFTGDDLIEAQIQFKLGLLNPDVVKKKFADDIRNKLLFELENLKKDYKKHPFFKTQSKIDSIEVDLKKLG